MPDTDDELFARLRKLAEQKVSHSVRELKELEPDAVSKLIHDLRVHQVELELQNDELRRTQQELEISRDRFAKLYHQAPVGYLTIDHSGLVTEANQTFSSMLNVGLSKIIRSPLIKYIHSQDLALFRGRFKAFFKNPEHKNMVIRLRGGSDRYFYARLEGRTATESMLITREGILEPAVMIIVSDITELKRIEDRMRRLAFLDPLTDLPNRAMILRRLTQFFSEARRHGQMRAILFIDLDNFKRINDSLGHPMGDKLLQNVAQRLIKVMRREDTVGRLGGDEFVVLLSESGDKPEVIASHAHRAAEKIKVVLSTPSRLGVHELHVTPSIGIALFPMAKESPDDVLKRADTAMYHAKAVGRNAIRFYQRSMQTAADLRISMENELCRALEAEEFMLYYQPQVDTQGRIVGAEALLRWQHPTRGLVTPNLFIGLAEETGLILGIGQWVLVNAALQVKAWKDMGLCEPDNFLAINVSPRQFHQQDFISQVIDVGKKTGMHLSCIKLEITEGLMMAGENVDIDKMAALKKVGVGFSLDDFGTGYSSLAYLRRMPVSELKIDKSFIQDIVTDQNDATIVETIIAMANHLGLGVIAEGVETESGMRFLRSHGCTMYQGYYFSQPLPADELTTLLRASALGKSIVPMHTT